MMIVSSRMDGPDYRAFDAWVGPTIEIPRPNRAEPFEQKARGERIVSSALGATNVLLGVGGKIAPGPAKGVSYVLGTAAALGAAEAARQATDNERRAAEIRESERREAERNEKEQREKKARGEKYSRA